MNPPPGVDYDLVSSAGVSWVANSRFVVASQQPRRPPTWTIQ